MAAADLPLILQTAYAELLDRCGADAFAAAFPEAGSFTAKTIRGRRYWYFQASEGGARRQRYVGPETPELIERITRHREARDDARERQTLVSTLVRSAHLARTIPEIGEVVEALAGAGVFRLRGVLVGTVAYQTYPAMLGTRLPARSAQTADVDVAQFSNVSVAIGDETPAVLDVLKGVNGSFHAIPHLHPGHVTAYRAASGIRVEFLTPNEGPDTDVPATLPALGTDAQQLRFLDFLIHEPEPAVLLHGRGVFVLVPAPHRYAVHKLIVAGRRAGDAKAEKDIRQAEALFDVLARKRPRELRATWTEALARGKTWRRLVGESMGRMQSAIRDRALKAVGATRSIVPGLDLAFAAPAGRYDAERDIVTFLGEAGGKSIRCAITRETLEDHFGADGMDKEGRLRIFRDNRPAVERLARAQYLHGPVGEPDTVLIRTEDVEELLRTRAGEPPAP